MVNGWVNSFSNLGWSVWNHPSWVTNQIIGDGFFKSNKSLEGDGVFRELPDIKVGVAETPKIKINAGIPQNAAKDGDVQPKLLPGDCVEENGFNRSGGIGGDRTELRKFS